MSVPFDYYWNLRKEAKEVSEKYYDRNLPERFNNFKADKILYEKKAKTVKFHPYIGRYDKYLYQFCPGRKYKPGKLLTEAPDYLSYAYYYKEDKPVFVRDWDDPEIHELEYRKSPKQLIYKPQRRFYRTIHYITDNGFVSFDPEGISDFYIYTVHNHETFDRYFEFSYPAKKNRSGKETYPESFTEEIVSKDRKKLDLFEYHGNSYICTHYVLDGPCNEFRSNRLENWEDSKYVDVSVEDPFSGYNDEGPFKITLSVPGYDLNPLNNGYKPVDTSKFR